MSDKLEEMESGLAASLSQRLALKKDIPNYMAVYMKLNDREIVLKQQVEKLRERVISRSRKVVALPLAHRGSLPVVGDIPPLKLHNNVREGREIVESYVHADLLPKTAFEWVPADTDPFNRNGIVHVNEIHFPEYVAHEIVHNIETQSPAVLKKSCDFLTKRAAGEHTFET